MSHPLIAKSFLLTRLLLPSFSSPHGTEMVVVGVGDWLGNNYPALSYPVLIHDKHPPSSQCSLLFLQACDVSVDCAADQLSACEYPVTKTSY